MKQYFSIYETGNDGFVEKNRYTKKPAPKELDGAIVMDLYDIRSSADANRKALRKHKTAFSSVRSAELSEAINRLIKGRKAQMDPSISVYEFLGRLQAYEIMTEEPDDVEELAEYIRDTSALESMGRQLYSDIKPMIDRMQAMQDFLK